MVSNHDFWLVANRLSRNELSNCLSNCRDQGGNISNFKKSNRSTDSSTDRFEMRGHLIWEYITSFHFPAVLIDFEKFCWIFVLQNKIPCMRYLRFSLCAIALNYSNASVDNLPLNGFQLSVNKSRVIRLNSFLQKYLIFSWWDEKG